MSKYLISTVETYRADTDKEAQIAIEEAKKDSRFELAKYTCEFKEVKQKGEIVDAYYKVTLSKIFDNIKEPSGRTEISYSTPGTEVSF